MVDDGREYFAIGLINGQFDLRVRSHAITSTVDGRLQFRHDDGVIWGEVAAGQWQWWKAIEPPTLTPATVSQEPDDTKSGV